MKGKIAIASDHAGINLKPQLIKLLQEEGYEYVDYGTYTTDSCDYPDYALKAAEAVKDGVCDMGILICGTGIGMSIAANKVPTIRCALCENVFSAKATRMHNNANMLAFGERVIGVGLMGEIVKAFLNTPYEGGRHDKRIQKITEIEKKYNK